MDLWHIPAIDQHAQNLLAVEAATLVPFRAALTQGRDSRALDEHSKSSLTYRRSMRDLAALLGCEATEEQIVACRADLGFDELAALSFRASKIERIFLDDRLRGDQIFPLEGHARFVPVRRILHVEPLAEELIGAAASFDAFLERFRGALEAPPENVVALKSTIGPRCGLDVQPASAEAARSAWESWKKSCEGEQGRPQLADQSLLGFLHYQVLEIAARRQLPVQFQTGVGGGSAGLRVGDPMHLRPLLEDARFKEVPIVLLNSTYLYAREAGHLAALHPNVYVSLDLAAPLLSAAGMRASMRALLELAPTDKLMYSSGARGIPELYYLAAKWGRAALGECLDEAVRDTDLTTAEAEAAGEAILRGNAERVYRLDGPAP
jgi:uncharacterized protein